MNKGLKITKKGKLINTKLIYNKTIKECSYTTKDVTNSAISYLFYPCSLDTNTTLKDIFLLLNSNLKKFDSIFGSWCKEIVTEGLTPTPDAYKPNEYSAEGIEYLELYKCLLVDKSNNISHGLSRPEFHGVGYKLKKDKLFPSGEIEQKKGGRINWSLSLTASNKIIDLPIKLNYILKVYNNDFSTFSKNNKFELAKYSGIEYTLGEILNGILWELSFYGNPNSRKKLCEKLRNIENKINKKKETQKNRLYKPRKYLETLIIQRKDKN
jgi:hypothetical protein